jgi:hypothetical protein
MIRTSAFLDHSHITIREYQTEYGWNYICEMPAFSFGILNVPYHDTDDIMLTLFLHQGGFSEVSALDRGYRWLWTIRRESALQCIMAHLKPTCYTSQGTIRVPIPSICPTPYYMMLESLKTGHRLVFQRGMHITAIVGYDPAMDPLMYEYRQHPSYCTTYPESIPEFIDAYCDAPISNKTIMLCKAAKTDRALDNVLCYNVSTTPHNRALLRAAFTRESAQDIVNGLREDIAELLIPPVAQIVIDYML